MRPRFDETHQETNSVAEPILVALDLLLRARHYAADTGSDLWDFAIEISHLHTIGLTDNDLRWLVRKGYVSHASEVTRPGQNGREFRSMGDITFAERTCFVLTEAGTLRARSVTEDRSASGVGSLQSQNGRSKQFALPNWNAETRELSLNGVVLKRFKWQAINQEIVLSAFQEDGWPPVIDDPLPPKPDQDPKRRLQDTIKALNRNQEHFLIRFHGNGAGDGIRWELSSKDRPDSPAGSAGGGTAASK